MFTRKVSAPCILLELHCCLDRLEQSLLLLFCHLLCIYHGFCMEWDSGVMKEVIALSNTHILKRIGKHPSNWSNIQSLENPESVRRIPDKEDCDFISLSSTEFLVMATLWKLRTENRSLPPNKCRVMGFHPFQLAEYGATCFRERSAHETVLRRQLWNRYSQTSSR